MVVDIARYEINRDFAINWYETNSKDDIVGAITQIASITMVPAVAVAYWLGEHTNWHPDAVRTIKRLMAFYGYTDIKGKPKDSPI